MASILRAALNMARRGIGRFRAADMSGVSCGVKDAHRSPAPAESGLFGISSAGYGGIALGALIGWAVGNWTFDTIGHNIKKHSEMRAVDDSELRKCD